jgi:hypothetical protein
MQLAKYNILLHYQPHLAWEILFNYQVYRLFNEISNIFYISFRWSNYSITSKFIIKYCYYGRKLKNQFFIFEIIFFRVHKVLNNNIPLVLEYKKKILFLFHLLVQCSDVLLFFV